MPDGKYYRDWRYPSKRWIKLWGRLNCSEITHEMLQACGVRQKTKISAHAANWGLRFLRTTFNYGIKHRWIRDNPANGIDKFPFNRSLRYIPSLEDVEKVLATARQDAFLSKESPKFFTTSSFQVTYGDIETYVFADFCRFSTLFASSRTEAHTKSDTKPEVM